MVGKLWSDAVDAAAIGKTEDVYDAAGTVTLKQGAKDMLGFIALMASSTQTSAENGAPVLKINSKDLNITQEEIHLSGALTDGIATNDKESVVVAQYIPWLLDPGIKKLDNAQIDFSVTSTTTTTGGWDTAIGVLMTDGKVDPQFINELTTGAIARALGGAISIMRAGVKTATPTSFTNPIKITSQGKELIGLCGYANPNGPTAGEAVVGVTDFIASQIPDFAPQKWPMIMGWSAGIGTPVGTPTMANLRNGVYWPTRFPLPETNFDMSVQQFFATALTNEADGIAGALWR